jgi:hypothetical protein
MRNVIPVSEPEWHEPRTVPFSLTVTTPSSRMLALSHLYIVRAPQMAMDAAMDLDDDAFEKLYPSGR